MKKRAFGVALAMAAVVAIVLKRPSCRTRPRVALLLGAGFSQALGIPGTRELTDLIDAHYAERKKQLPSDTDALVFERLSSELRSEFADSYNFEVLLDSLEASRQFLGPIPYLRPRPQSSLRPIMQLQQWLRPNGLEILDKIMETGYVVIRNALLAAQFKVSNGARNRVREFFAFLAKPYRVACINLNYDEVVDESVPYLQTGFHVTVGDADGKAFDARFLLDSLRHQMVHLHGSVFYRFPSGGTMVRNPNEQSAARQAGFVHTTSAGIHADMISGLAKSEKLMRPPYNSFYYWATDVLQKTPRVVICGYGVGDLHINAWLAQAAIAHGQDYRLCFITRSDDLEKENERLQGLLKIAAGFRYVADAPSLESLLKFDQGGFARYNSLAVLRYGFPQTLRNLRHSMTKVMAFLR